MVNAQSWLNSNLSRSRTNLYVSNKNLEGSLKIERFGNLKELVCSFNQLSRLEISDCPNLRTIKCNDNQITEIIIKNCPRVKEFRCANNLLTGLDLSQNSGLEILNVGSNNFSEQDLSFLSHLVNLKELFLGNSDREKIEAGIYNRFVGSLGSLKNMSELVELGIANTDIDSGLEYVPNSIKNFYCLADKNQDAKVKVIADFFSNEHGVIEADGLGKIINFSQKFQDYKQWIPEIGKVKDQFKDNIEKFMVSEGISSEKLNEMLTEMGYLKELNETWQDYLEKTFNLDKFNKKKKYVLLAVNILKDRSQLLDLEKKVSQLQEQVSSLELQTQIEIPPKSN